MICAFVLDASVAMSWLFVDEATPSVLKLREYLKNSYAVCPNLWPIEVANVLWHAEKRGRIKAFHSARFKNILNQMRIEIDDNTTEFALRRNLELAREYDITVYDACYLELALREGCPLATLDKQLRKAAARAGVPVLPKKI